MTKAEAYRAILEDLVNYADSLGHSVADLENLRNDLVYDVDLFLSGDDGYTLEDGRVLVDSELKD